MRGIRWDMDRACDLLSPFFVLLCSALPARAVQGAALERGTAITDPSALRELDHGRFGLRPRARCRRHRPTRRSTNGQLFALPAMAPVRKALDDEFERYIARHKADLPNETIGVGTSLRLSAVRSRAALLRRHRASCWRASSTGWIAPISSEANCGEIRLIYRLTRTNMSATGDNATSPRLPMTLNVVLKAKGDSAIDGSGKAITCAEIARRWLAAGDLPLTGAELAAKLISAGWPARLDRAGKHRPHRNQSSDRARAEIAISAISAPTIC